MAVGIESCRRSAIAPAGVSGLAAAVTNVRYSRSGGGTPDYAVVGPGRPTMPAAVPRLCQGALRRSHRRRAVDTGAASVRRLWPLLWPSGYRPERPLLLQTGYSPCYFSPHLGATIGRADGRVPVGSRQLATLQEAPRGAHALSPARELGGPSMDSQAQSKSERPGSVVGNVSDVHNASVDEEAARQGGCAQVHLPTGRMCTSRHGHNGSCEFSSAGEADAALAKHKAADHW